MGNDGGSIPKRRELVREAARLPTTAEMKETALESLTHAWEVCPLSGTPLDFSNIVSDARGSLFNYEAVLQCLLPSPDAPIADTQGEAFRRSGIKSVKDVVKLKLSTKQDESGRACRTCPVSLKELGATAKAVYVVPCGHVFAETAMKEIAESEADAPERRCPECSEPFESSNVIPILPTSEAEIARLVVRVEDLKARGLSHSLKKDKSSRKKRKADDADGDGDGGKADGQSKKEKRPQEKGIGSRINNASTASLTAKVLAEQEERIKRRKMIAGAVS